MTIQSLLSPVLFLSLALITWQAPAQETEADVRTKVTILGHASGVDGFPEDAVYERGVMVNGQRNGTWQRFHSNGALRAEIHFVQDVPFGPYRLFDEQGQCYEAGRWEKGANVGKLERYWPNGSIQQRLSFDVHGRGQGQQRHYHDNGQLDMVVTLVDGEESGDLIRLDREGRVISRTPYQEGRIIQESL